MKLIIISYLVILYKKSKRNLCYKSGDVQWPPRSCDITPLDFFLWGYLKSVVYLNKAKTINVLKDNINCAVSDITPDLCEKMTQNWSSRMQFLKNSRGGHLEDITVRCITLGNLVFRL